MTTHHLILTVVALLVAGLVLSFRAPLLSLAPATTVPFPPGELWELNQGQTGS